MIKILTPRGPVDHVTLADARKAVKAVRATNAKKKPKIYKVVYNACFGVFDLSQIAIDWLLERGSKNIDLFTDNKGKPVIVDGRTGYWRSTAPRHDPLLVKCVQTLEGNSFGSHAELFVLKLEGFQYRIAKYDGEYHGMEHVEQPHDIEWEDARKV